MATKKYISFICCILLATVCANAQESIKKASDQHDQTIQRELEEQKRKEREVAAAKAAAAVEKARIEKAQLNLKDLLQLLQSKNLDYVGRFLTDKGWKSHSAGEETATQNKTIIWAFDKETNNSAKGWFYFYLYPTDDNAVTYTITDDKQLERLKSQLTSNGYKLIVPADVNEHGLESTYRDNLYEIKVKKGAGTRYDFSVFNYKQAEKRKVEVESAINEAVTAFEDGRFNDALRHYTEAVDNSTDSRISIKETASLKFRNKAERLAELNGGYDEVSKSLLQYADNLNLTTNFTSVAYSQCEIYRQKAETLFVQKKYDDAKTQYLSYKECKPNAEGIDEKIAECDYLATLSKPIKIGVSSFTGYYRRVEDEEAQTIKSFKSDERFIVNNVVYDSWKDYWAGNTRSTTYVGRNVRERYTQQELSDLDYIVSGEVIQKEAEKTTVDKNGKARTTPEVIVIEFTVQDARTGQVYKHETVKSGDINDFFRKTFPVKCSIASISEKEAEMVIIGRGKVYKNDVFNVYEDQTIQGNTRRNKVGELRVTGLEGDFIKCKLSSGAKEITAKFNSGANLLAEYSKQTQTFGSILNNIVK